MKKILISILLMSIGNVCIALPASWERYIDNDSEKAQKLMNILVVYTDARQDETTNEYLKELYATYLHEAQPDDALTFYTGPNVSYTNGLYKPTDMKVIQDSYYLWRDKTRPATQYQVRTAVHDPLDTMAKEFYHRFKSPLRINSARRSYHEQQNRFSAACFAEGLCAFPGTSEHQNGFAVDIGLLHGEKYTRMKNNAHKYGFHQSYQKGKEIDGFQVETWHRRRIGTTLAGHLHKNNLSFTQRTQQRDDI